MSHVLEGKSLRTRYLYDVAKLALLALALVPVYLLLNQYWQSVILLLGLYGLLGLFCIRLGEYVHRAMRRLPAEIPPWYATSTIGSVAPWGEERFGAAEAIRSAHRDPQYVQTVLKPRLRRVLAYRLGETPDPPLEVLDHVPLAQVEPALLDFLGRQEPTGLWARFRYRRRRLNDVLEALRRLEAL
jgi:hypothetical protein